MGVEPRGHHIRMGYDEREHARPGEAGPGDAVALASATTFAFDPNRPTSPSIPASHTTR